MPDFKKFTFERDKFIELMLYFAKRGIEEGLVIGSTKLTKLLFFTDTRAYIELGLPVTGARYQKLQFGPAPRALVPVRRELIDNGLAMMKDDDPEEWNDILIPLREPHMALFTRDEVRIADAVFEELRPFNAMATSDYSHLRSAGWRVVDYSDDIPYESAFVLTDPAPVEAIERGRELAAVYGW